MADAKITALTAETAPISTDVFPMVDDPAGTPVTKKVTLANIEKAMSGTAKCWGKFNANSTTINASFNITSIADTNTGIMNVTIATDFSSADWCFTIAIENIDASIDASTDVQVPQVGLAGQAAGTLNMICGNASGTAAVDPTKWHMAGFGVSA